MECSTKVFGDGALGIKAQMSSVTACLVWAFPANSIKNAKKLSGGLAALNTATHGAVTRAIENKDLDTTSGSTLLLNATDAWAKLGLKADRLLLVCCGLVAEAPHAAVSCRGRQDQQRLPCLCAGPAGLSGAVTLGLLPVAAAPSRHGVSEHVLSVELVTKHICNSCDF